MKFEACQYAEKSGWNMQPDGALDSPLTNGNCDLHSQTMTLTWLWVDR
jgi:hypothetical protein